MPGSRVSKRKKTTTQKNVKKMKNTVVRDGATRSSSRANKGRRMQEESEEESDGEESGEEEEEESEEEEEEEEEDDGMEQIKYVLTDAHRAFNQRLLSAGVLTYRRAKELKDEVVEDFEDSEIDEEDDDEEDDDDSGGENEKKKSLANKSLDEMIEDTNAFLNKYQIQIKQSKYDGLGEDYIGFANNIATEIPTKNYDEATCILLKELINVCIESPNGIVPDEVATEDFYALRNKHSKIKERITITNCLKRLVQDKWIAKGVDDQLYRLGPRTFVELKDYLESHGATKSRGEIYICDKAVLTPA